MTGRADWQNLMMRFSTSGFDNRRLFVNVDYIKGAPLKIAVASSIGAVMGVIRSLFLRRQRCECFRLEPVRGWRPVAESDVGGSRHFRRA